jgi:hypothetical protein
MPPFSIVPLSRPDLALTLITENGKPSLALLPKDSGNRLQLFDMPAPCPETKPTVPPATREPHALLLQAGAKAGIPKMPADYIGEGHIVDFVVSFVKTGDKTAVVLEFTAELIKSGSLAQAIANISARFYGIPLDANLVGTYLTLLKQPTPNKGLADFFKRVKGNKAVMDKIIAAGTDYAALAREIGANGFAISPQDLQNYLSSWQFFGSVLTGLKDSVEISEAQYDDRIGYTSGDYNITGLGPESDQALINGYLSATSWVTKLDGFGDFGLPMQALMIPVSTIMWDGLSGQHNFSFKELGPMMFDGFTDAMQATADGLQDFGNDLSSL